MSRLPVIRTWSCRCGYSQGSEFEICPKCRRIWHQGTSRPERPLISLSLGGVFLHDSKPARVVLRRDVISVGCADVTPAALRHLLAEWRARFDRPEEVELQCGEEGSE